MHMTRHIHVYDLDKVVSSRIEFQAETFSAFFWTNDTRLLLNWNYSNSATVRAELKCCGFGRG